jgi:hypothetical protein
MEMQIAEDLSSILSFVVLLIGLVVGLRTLSARRRAWQAKSERLEQYLKAAAGKGAQAERSTLEVMQDVGLTLEEAIQISFENQRIGRRADAGQISFHWAGER